MTFATAVRALTLALAAAVAGAGMLVVVGVLVREGITDQVRIALGLAVVLYGVYKFTVTWFRGPGRNNR